MKKTIQPAWLVLLLATGCATSSAPVPSEPGTRTIGRSVVIQEGPELEVALGFYQATASLGEEWLVVAVEMTAAPRGGPVQVARADIAVMTPDGRRLGLVDQETFRENYSRLRITLDRALRSLPIFSRYDTAQMPCDRWFLVGPFGGFAIEELPVNTFQVCAGPLVFRVPGGVQPGRWRLLIELPESRVDIPFELGDDG